MEKDLFGNDVQDFSADIVEDIVSDDEVVAESETGTDEVQLELEDIIKEKNEQCVVDESSNREIIDMSSTVLINLINNCDVELSDKQINRLKELDKTAPLLSDEEIEDRFKAIVEDRVYVQVIKHKKVNQDKKVEETGNVYERDPVIQKLKEEGKLPLGPVDEEPVNSSTINNVEDIKNALESNYQEKDLITNKAEELLRAMLSEDEIEELDSISIEQFKIDVMEDKGVVHIPCVEFVKAEEEKTKLYQLFDRQLLESIVNQNHTLIEVLRMISPEFQLNTKDVKALTSEIVRTLLNLNMNKNKVLSIIAQNKQFKKDFEELSKNYEELEKTYNELKQTSKELFDFKEKNIVSIDRYVLYISSKDLYITFSEGKNKVGANDFAGTKDLFSAIKFTKESASSFLSLLVEKCNIISKEDIASIKVKQIYLGD